MAYNGSGVFSRLYSWATDKANNIVVTASRMDDEMNGFADGLTNAICRDGQTTITANIPFNSKKLTGLADGTAATDSINVGQVQNNVFGYWGTTGGAADAYTLAPSPTITAYAATQNFTAKIHATNTTTTPYLQISGIANPASTAVIKKINQSGSEIAVEPGDLVAGGIYTFQRNSSNNAWILLQPPIASLTNQGISYLQKPIILSNNVGNPNTHIDFSGGVFQFSDGTGQAVSTAMTKMLQSSGSWSAGAAGNMLLTGARANSSTYHLFAIHNPTTGVSDYGALLGVAGTAPDPTASLPSGYTKFKRVGSILTDGSGNIRPFTQRSKTFEFTTPVLELDASGSNGSALQNTSLPAGIVVNGHFTIGLDLASGSSVGNYYASVQNADQNFIPSGSGARGYTVNVFKSASATAVASVACYAFSNTSRQIRLMQAGAGTLCNITFITHGWDDILL